MSEQVIKTLEDLALRTARSDTVPVPTTNLLAFCLIAQCAIDYFKPYRDGSDVVAVAHEQAHRAAMLRAAVEQL